MAEAPTLLVADDDPAVRESLERTLKREGYQVAATFIESPRIAGRSRS